MKPETGNLSKAVAAVYDRRSNALKSLTQVSALALVALATTGCETVRFGVSATHEGSTITASYGDGKTVIAAEQDGSRVGLNFRR